MGDVCSDLSEVKLPNPPPNLAVWGSFSPQIGGLRSPFPGSQKVRNCSALSLCGVGRRRAAQGQGHDGKVLGIPSASPALSGIAYWKGQAASYLRPAAEAGMEGVEREATRVPHLPGAPGPAGSPSLWNLTFPPRQHLPSNPLSQLDLCTSPIPCCPHSFPQTSPVETELKHLFLSTLC